MLMSTAVRKKKPHITQVREGESSNPTAPPKIAVTEARGGPTTKQRV
jgi:hypothetical protein